MKFALSSVVCAAVLAAADRPAAAQTLTENLKREPVPTLAADARKNGSAVRGAIVFTAPGPGCTKCHVAGSADQVGPDLTTLGPEATDEYLVEALLDPSKVIRQGYESATVTTFAGKTYQGRVVEQTADKIALRDPAQPHLRMTLDKTDVDGITPSKTSAMPANVVDQLKDRGQFLDLARYLMELAETAKTRPHGPTVRGGGEASPELRGLALVNEFHCAACHKDDLSDNPLTVRQAPKLSWAAGRIDPSHLERYIADPLGTKPGASMPDLLGGLSADDRGKVAKSLAHYVASLGEGRPFERQPIDPAAADRGKTVFHEVGCVACHSPRDDAGRETLAAASVPLGPTAAKYNRDGLVEFLKSPHAARPSGRMPSLKLTHWEAVDLASYLLVGSPAAADAEFRLDAALVADGKERFDKLGCVRCHGEGTAPVKPAGPPLSQLKAGQGCLSGQVGNWPLFALADEQREAIRAALARTPGSLAASDQATLTLTAFRCLNCHQRGELGGVSDDRSAYFQTTDPNLGPQGRIPPPLTNVGAKLKPTWLRQVLVSGKSIRPYVKTRMPQYGAENVGHLVDLFGRADSLPPAKYGTIPGDPKEARKVAAEMVGSAGLNCIACHTFQLKSSANMSAVDLTEMGERLKKDWFYQYMKDPQGFSPNTVMPSFWPGGRASRQDIFGGDTDAQLEALWEYLLEGRQAPTPRGLIVEPIELLATADEAVMLRRSYPGIGKRGIGVGYPGQVNIAFDAEQVRLGTIWKGKFAEPSGVWRSQGHGNVRPLGTDLIDFPKGPDVDDAGSPWVADDGRPPHHRFEGYSLDPKRRPTFHYRVGDVTVDDYPTDETGPDGKGTVLRRKLTLKASAGSHELAFRAAAGKTIRDEGNGVYLIDQRLRVHVLPGHTGEIVDAADGKQLRVPLAVGGDPITLTVEYAW